MLGVLPFVEDPDLSVSAARALAQHLPPCTDTSKKSLTKSDKRILCESDWQLASGKCPLPIACDCIVPPDQCGGQKMVVPDHIGGGQEGEADRAGEQDGAILIIC